MMTLDDGFVLSKVHHYRLQRPDGAIRIEVHEVILGSDTKFLAVPVERLPIDPAGKEFHVEGNSEFEALERLVEKIKGLPAQQIFPRNKK